MARSLRSRMKRGRPPVAGPEERFLRRLLEHSLPTDKRLQRMVFREPNLPVGLPDLVIAYPGQGGIEFCPERRALEPNHIRLMHHIYSVGGGSLDTISEALLLSSNQIESLVTDLERASVVHRRGDFVSVRAFRDIFTLRRIVAVEAKIGDWRRALRQAAGNTWFASHSYIVIPPSRVLSDIVNEARSQGIGVWVFDGCSVTVAANSIEHALPTSYGSWLINEWANYRTTRVSQCLI